MESETLSKSYQEETNSVSDSLITSCLQMDTKMEKENKNIVFLESFARQEVILNLYMFRSLKKKFLKIVFKRPKTIKH